MEVGPGEIAVVYIVTLGLFVMVAPGVVGLTAQQAPPWLRFLAMRTDAPSSARFVSRAFSEAVALATQILVVGIVAEPLYGPGRLLLLVEVPLAAAWLLYLRRLGRRRPG